MEGLDLEEAYKRVAKEGKRVRLFYIKNYEEKEFLIERLEQAIRLVADFPRETKPTFLT